MSVQSLDIQRGAALRTTSWRPAQRTELLADLDPDLFDAIPAQDAADLAPSTRVPVMTLPAGSWDPSQIADRALLGVVVISGRFGASVGVGHRRHMEIVGPGDVGQPWVPGADAANIPAGAQWRVLQEAEIAVLDQRFALLTGRWPALTRALMERLILRSRRLVFQLAVLSEPQIARRIELIMWHFADRWGRVTLDGVLLELPLSHELLAQVVGAQRPSVTTSLGDLRQRGRLDRRSDGVWMLTGKPPRALAPLHEQAGLPPHDLS